MIKPDELKSSKNIYYLVVFRKGLLTPALECGILGICFIVFDYRVSDERVKVPF